MKLTVTALTILVLFVVITPVVSIPVVYGTNESSYKYGYDAAHQDFTQTADCRAPNYWWHDVCQHAQPPKLAAVTGPGHCYKTKEGGGETCESGDWIPVLGQTSNHTVILANGTRVPLSHLNLGPNETVGNMTGPPAHNTNSTSNMTTTMPHTNGTSYKYWLTDSPDKPTICTDVYCTNACKKPANATGIWCPIAFPWDLKVHVWSNDPSFQHGFKTAVTWYQGFFSQNNDDDWDRPNIDSANETCHNDSPRVANMTTCLYGFVQGFRQWCSTDTKNCAEAAANGELPREILHIFNYGAN